MTMFCLSHIDWDEYIPHLFAHDSKTADEWKQDVAEAMNIAAQRAVDAHKENWIGSSDITGMAVHVLVEKGYIHVKPIEVTMQGSGIIQDDRDIDYPLNQDIKEKIFACNKAVAERIDNES